METFWETLQTKPLVAVLATIGMIVWWLATVTNQKKR